MGSPKRVTKSVKADPELWRKAKVFAAERDVDLSDVVEEGILLVLRRGTVSDGRRT